MNIAKLSPFIGEDRTIRVKGRLKHSNLDYNAKHPILLTAKHPVVQTLLEKAHQNNLHDGARIFEKHASTRVRDHRVERCAEKNHVEMYHMQTQERQSNSPRERIYMCSHSPIPESTTSDPLKSSRYNVP